MDCKEILLLLIYMYLTTVGCDEISCDSGQWGNNCTSTCPAFCTSYGCDKKAGFCYECINGYQGKYCDIPCPLKCIRCDQYSGKCYTSCSINCRKCTTEHPCLYCKDGWFGKSCEKPCSLRPGCAGSSCSNYYGNCPVCHEGWYGYKCENQCPNCFVSCYKSGYCPHCISGFWGRFCEKKCTGTCEMCDKNDGQCVLCPDKYWGPNCSSLCSLNNCERCDVNTGICKKCKAGYWGTDCERQCNNCIDTKCDISSGVCENCKMGYAGEHCNITCETSRCSHWYCNRRQGFACATCKYGYWGTFCENKCIGKNCLICSKDFGICTKCTAGYWSSSCEMKCPVNCILSCDKSSGTCNYKYVQDALYVQDAFLNKVYSNCKPGYWGTRCENKCSEENCESCDSYHYRYSSPGLCSKCKSGFWGFDCRSRCSPDKCMECNIDDGLCALCKTGFWGKECNLLCSGQCRCCNAISGKCVPDKCSAITVTPYAAKDNDSLLIVGIVLIICSIVILLLVIVFLSFRINRKMQRSTKTSAQHQNIEDATVAYRVSKEREITKNAGQYTNGTYNESDIDSKPETKYDNMNFFY